MLSEKRDASSFNRYTKGLLVKLNEPVTALNSLDMMLNPTTIASANGNSRPKDPKASAADRTDSTAWQKQYARAAARSQENGRVSLSNGDEAEQPVANGKLHKDTSGDRELEASEQQRSDSPPDTRPSPGAPLGEAGWLHGRELITALRHARHVLQAGLQNLAAARDEAVHAQRAFYPLTRLLEDADLLLESCRKGPCAEESSVALAAARTWMLAAQTTVQELDANASGLLLDSGAGSCLAPEWALFAQQAALKLQDLENELWAGHILGEPVKTSPPKNPATPRRVSTGHKSSLPYSHWRNKPAL